MKPLFYKTLTFFLLLVGSAYTSPWIISHRGGGENYPENTLLAFSKSIEIGCDAIEIDVQVTKESEENLGSKNCGQA